VPTRGGPPDTKRVGSVEADTVAHCDDSTEGDYVNSLTFTELFSGWTENRWSQFTNHFKPTFKLQNREKKGSRTVRIYEQKPQTPYQRLLASPDIAEATKAKLRAEHAALDPFELKKSIEVKLRKFFTALGNLNRESTKT
jgi:hypothetical protein